jgi:hypothetical protein
LDFLRPIKNLTRKVVSLIKGEKDRLEAESADRELLTHWQTQFDNDYFEKQKWNNRFDEWEGMYHGNRVFDNVRQTQDKTPRTMINFPRMIIESQIDLNIPQPIFKGVAEDDVEQVKKLQSLVEYKIRSNEPSLEEINQITERGIRKFGTEMLKVHWNNQCRRAGYVGDVELSVAHVKDIIPNVGATSIEDLEWYHHVVNRTENYILRKWPHITRKDLEDKAILKDEYDEMRSAQDIGVEAGRPTDEESGVRRYTIVETTYRDMDGDICKLWWSSDLLIEHTPKFFYRRDPETSEIMEQEILGFEPLPDGTEKPITADYYIPKCWDIAYGVYIPRDKCFWGVSMMEDMKDPAESIKKLTSILEEKILRGTKKILTNSPKLKDRLLDPLSEVIVFDEAAEVKDVDMTGNWELEINFLNLMKDWLQLITGATDAALGKQTANVTSGKQAQAYISQAQQMTDKVTASRNAMFRKLYRIIADFYMAFADEDRPFRLQGAMGKDAYGSFNRLNMLRDMNGNLIYPDYDIEVGAEAGFMKQKSEIVTMITFLANSGRFEPSPGNLMLLNILDKLGVPQMKDAIKQMEQMLGPAALAMNGLNADVLIQMFAQLPPEEQYATLQGLQQMLGAGVEAAPAEAQPAVAQTTEQIPTQV